MGWQKPSEGQCCALHPQPAAPWITMLSGLVPTSFLLWLFSPIPSVAPALCPAQLGVRKVLAACPTMFSTVRRYLAQWLCPL